MMTQNDERRESAQHRGFVYDDLPYVLPMAIFLFFTWLGGYGAPEKQNVTAADAAATTMATTGPATQTAPSSLPATAPAAAAGRWTNLFPISYVLKTFLAAGALWFFWNRYTRISWAHWQLGVVVGVIGLVQWVGMEKLLLFYFPNYPRPGGPIFDPHAHFEGQPGMMWAFAIIRWGGAALVVPVMEELFWRDWLWRTLAAPNDYRLASVGEWDWKVFLIVAAAFATVHVQWITALGWGLMIGWLLVYTRSLGACIVAHGVTNFLLGAYVQYTHDWYFW
jgi:hypothetical protein